MAVGVQRWQATRARVTGSVPEGARLAVMVTEFVELLCEEGKFLTRAARVEG